MTQQEKQLEEKQLETLLEMVANAERTEQFLLVSLANIHKVVADARADVERFNQRLNRVVETAREFGDV